MSTTTIKIALTKVGTAYSATQQYRLHDYIVLDDCTMYVCKRVDPTTMTCVGHDLTDSLYWDKCVDLSDAVSKANVATTNATSAQQTATEAKATAEDAKAVANEASTTATSAQEVATSAQGIANKAQTSADNAQSSADKAQTTATSAQQTATEAKTTADEALSTAKGLVVPKLVYLTEAEYDALEVKEADAVYMLYEEE